MPSRDVIRMEHLYNDVFAQVERKVCDIVCSRGLEVRPDELYTGRGNIPVARAMARNYIFYVLHNSYGFSYSAISRRAEMNKESVMRCIRKVQYLSESDALYKHIMEAIQ